MTKIKRNGKTFFFRTYQEGDEKEIIPLINEVLGTKETLEHWQWKYAQNPQGHLSLIATDSIGTIIGHNGLQKKRGWYKGQIHLFLSSEDTVVKREHRGNGIFSSFPLFLPSEKFLLIGFPTHESISACKKFPTHYAENLFFNALPVYIKKIDFQTRIMYWWKRQHKNTLSVRKFGIDDLTILDTLWEKKKKEVSICVIRDSMYLRWKIFGYPCETNMYGLYSDNKCIGYLATARRGNICFITDLLVLNEYAESSLARCLEQLALSLHTHTIKILISDAKILLVLKNAGYLRVEEIIFNHINMIEQKENVIPYLTYSDTHLF